MPKEEKQFTLKEIEKLIKTCKTKQVTQFEYAGLKLSIGAPDKSPMTPAPLARGSAKKAQAITASANLRTQFELDHEVAETLHVEDPVRFEQMLINGELGEVKDD